MKEKLEKLIAIIEEMENIAIDKSMYQSLMFLEEDIDDFFEDLEIKSLYRVHKN